MSTNNLRTFSNDIIYNGQEQGSDYRLALQKHSVKAPMLDPMMLQGWFSVQVNPRNKITDRRWPFLSVVRGSCSDIIRYEINSFRFIMILPILDGLLLICFPKSCKKLSYMKKNVQAVTVFYYWTSAVTWKKASALLNRTLLIVVHSNITWRSQYFNIGMIAAAKIKYWIYEIEKVLNVQDINKADT